MMSAHERAALESWILDHRATPMDHRATPLARVPQSVPRDLERAFVLPNASMVVVLRWGTWVHYSHLGREVRRHGGGLETLFPYLDSLGLATFETPVMFPSVVK